jgi:hypothetical protein
MRYWDELLREQRNGLTVIVDKTWEDCSIRDLFDESCCDVEDLERKVNRGDLDWFMLRARVMYNDLELGSEICGGFLYEDARDVLRDGMADEMIWQAEEEAKRQLPGLIEGLLRVEVDKLAA